MSKTLLCCVAVFAMATCVDQTAVMREGMGEYKVFGCTVKYLTEAERKQKGLK